MSAIVKKKKASRDSRCGREKGAKKTVTGEPAKQKRAKTKAGALVAIVEKAGWAAKRLEGIEATEKVATAGGKLVGGPWPVVVGKVCGGNRTKREWKVGGGNREGKRKARVMRAMVQQKKKSKEHRSCRTSA